MLRYAGFADRSRLWTAALLALMFAACKEAKITDVPVLVARIDVSTTSLSLRVGESMQVTAVAISGSGRSLTARQIQWSTNNPGVANVSPNGQVNAVGVGNAQLTARSGEQSANINVTVTYGNFTIVVNNLLLSSVLVDVNGTALGSVNASATRTFTVPGAAQVGFEWEMVRPVLGARSLGEQPAGIFDPIDAGTQTTFTYEIDNIVATTTYFAPLITNQTTASLLMGVNMGLATENRCECAVTAGGNDVYFGYYRLFTNSNVRAYVDGSNYTSGFIFWDAAAINSVIVTGPGTARLLANVPPAGAARGMAIQSIPFTPPAFAEGKVYRNDRPRGSR